MQRPTKRGPRPPRSTAVQRPIAREVAHATSSELSADFPDDGLNRQRLVDDFELALREEHELTAEQRETVLEQFTKALLAAPVQLGAPDVADLRNSLAGTIDSLVQSEALGNADKESVLQQLNEALSLVDAPDVSRSREYAMRLDRDGLEKANEWLAEQDASPASGSSNMLPLPAKAARRAAPNQRRRR